MSLFRYSACSLAQARRRQAFIVALGLLASGLLTADPTQAVGVHSTLLTYDESTANGTSLGGVISHDGSIVAFSTSAYNLADDDTNNTYDVHVLNKVDHTFEVASRASGPNGALGNSQSLYPDLSLNGQHVVWVSRATNLVPEVSSGTRHHIYLRDRKMNWTELISIADPNVPPPGAHAPANEGVASINPPRISENGCRVVFTSTSTNLVANWPYWGSLHWNNVFLRDRCQDRTILVSRPRFGMNYNENSGAPVISRDGRFVAFVSLNTRLPLANSGEDVFVYDVEADEIVQRLDFDSMPGNAPFWRGSLDIDGAGKKVIGVSELQKTPEDTNDVPDAYVVDIRSGAFELASAYSDGSVADEGEVSWVSISDDGKRVAFSTYRDLTDESEELPSGAKAQTWIRDLETGVTRLISRRWQTGTGSVNYFTAWSRISPSGESAVFQTHENLDPRDTSFQSAQLYEGSGLSFQIVDPNPKLIDDGVVTDDLDRLKVYGRPVDGMAADGVTRLLLRFHAYQAGTVRFSISDDIHADSEYVGSLSSVLGNENSTDELDVPVSTLFSTGEKYAFAILTAPEGFDREGYAADSTSLTRSFFVRATDLGSGASMELERSLIRPPVVLVHGLWSKSKTWEYELLQSPYFDTYTYDYKSTNAAHFSENRSVGPNASRDALSDVRSRGYAATQVDYIGHSMGGILGRRWVAEDDCMFQCNKRSDNFFKGDLNRLITMGSPHSGSELANALWEIWQDNFPYAGPIHAINPWMCIDCGGIEDFRIGSDPVMSLGEAVVPAHAVVGTGGQENPISKINGLLWLYASTSVEEVFGLGVENDSIVKRTSQEGGLLPANVTLIGPSSETEAVHTSEPKEAAFGSRMEELLRLPVTDKEFAQGGFPASDYISGFVELRRASIMRSVSPEDICQDTCLHLQIIDGGPVFHPGTEVTLEATGLEGFEPQEVSFLFGDQEVLVDAPRFVATFTIPMDALGSIAVGAVARGQESWPPQGRYQFDFLKDIVVEQEASLLGLRLEPPVIKSSPAVPGRTLRVFGVFSDNVDRELVGYEVSFTSSDPAIAAVAKSGDVQFLQPGIASIVASYQTLTASAWVEVSTPPIALHVSQVSPINATVIVDKLNPLEGFRIFGTTNLTVGHTPVAGCQRLDLGLKNAYLVADIEPQGGETTYMEVSIPMPQLAPALALQVVTDKCAISPVVVADP